MTLNEYQHAAEKTAIYFDGHKILYPALGLAGEAGEVANKVKKMLRDDAENKAAVAAELGDVLWYVAALCRDLGVELEDLARANLDKLNSRKERGVLGGNGDNR